MKNIFTLLALFILVNLQAQRLERYVPINSDVVVQVQGDQIFNLMSEVEITNFITPEEVKNSGEVFDITDFGFDTREDAYYFYKNDGEIGWHIVVLGINNVTKATETFVSQFPTDMKDVNGYSVGLAEDMALAWNENMGILLKADIPKENITLEELQEEWRLENEDLQGDVLEEPTELDVMIRNLSAPSIFTDEEIKSKVTTRLMSIANNATSSSIMKSKSFQDGKHKKASAYLWIGEVDGLYKNFLNNELLKNTGMPFDMSGAYKNMNLGIKALTSNLIFDKDKINIETITTIDDEIKKVYKKMYNSKLDRSFLKYFNEDDMLAYTSFSVDTEDALETYPELMNKVYGQMFPDFKEEIDVLGDLFSILIDEEEIGEMVTGDGLILLHGIEESLVTYTDYEFDEEYNRTEVEKTKYSQIPIFTFMMGSENKDLMNKLLRLGVKHQFVDLQNTFFKLNTKALGSPFDTYATVQDDIAFITNSPERAQKYSTRKKTRNLGIHKKLLRRNIATMYINAEKAIGMGAVMMGMQNEFSRYLQDNYKDIRLTAGKFKGNKIPYNLTLTTNKDSGNSLRLLFNTFNEFTEFMKENDL